MISVASCNNDRRSAIEHSLNIFYKMATTRVFFQKSTKFKTWILLERAAFSTGIFSSLSNIYDKFLQKQLPVNHFRKNVLTFVFDSGLNKSPCRTAILKIVLPKISENFFKNVYCMVSLCQLDNSCFVYWPSKLSKQLFQKILLGSCSSSENFYKVGVGQ